MPWTKVLTESWTKNIEDIEIWDIVLSYKAKQDKFEYRTVTKLFIHENIDDELYELTIWDKILKVTELHRFYVLRDNTKNPYQSSLWYEWIASSRLKVWDTLMMSDWTYVKIDAINHYPIHETVYNLEVEENHNYFVEEWYLVHNAMSQFEKQSAADWIYDWWNAWDWSDGCRFLVNDMNTVVWRRCGDNVYLY